MYLDAVFFFFFKLRYWCVSFKVFLTDFTSLSSGFEDLSTLFIGKIFCFGDGDDPFGPPCAHSGAFFGHSGWQECYHPHRSSCTGKRPCACEWYCEKLSIKPGSGGGGHAVQARVILCRLNRGFPHYCTKPWQDCKASLLSKTFAGSSAARL